MLVLEHNGDTHLIQIIKVTNRAAKFFEWPTSDQCFPPIHFFPAENYEEWYVPYFFLYSNSLIHNKPGYEISCPILSIIMVCVQSEYVIGKLSIRSAESPAHYCGLGRLS